MQKTRFFSIAALALAAAAAGPAFALGDVTNNGGAGGNAVATGGTGGLGVGVGLGGNAQAGVLGSGNSASSSGVIGSGNSSNTNLLGQQQGQNQGQIATGGAGGHSLSGSISGATSNSGGNTFTTGATTQSTTLTTGATSQNVTTGANTQTVGATSQAVTTGATTQSNAGNNSSNATNVNVQGDTVHYEAARIPVSTAYAAPLTATNGTCMGSTSGGAQGAAFAISLGGTWTDVNCDIRYDAEALRAAGMPGAARARLCQKAEIAEAMKSAGTPCPGTKVAAAALPAAVDARPGAIAPSRVEYTDPIIRARLGLPPLKN